MQTLEGIIRISRGGTGFIDKEKNQGVDSTEESIRIPTERLGLALNGDKVLVELGNEPKVLKVLERNKTQFTGTLENDDRKWFVVPDDKRIHLDFFIKSVPKDAKVNQKVLIELKKWNNPERNPEAKILQMIGQKGEHEAEMRSILLNKGIDYEFPPEVEKEAKQINNKITPEEISRRLDLRDITTFTIDPADAKDFDDAISFEKTSDGFKIGVHIADVSHYVLPNTELDKEAKERGFSVYLVDRTIPMLPEVLSNDVCSLNPKEDKLAFSAIFEFDKNGKKQKHWLGKTIINSNKRFTYEEAQDILDKKNGPFYEELNILNTLAKQMNKGRIKRGSILFERDEVKIEIDDKGKPTKIYKKKRLETHKLVEEFMLLANREVTEHIEKHCKKDDIRELFIYRVHDLPNEDKLRELSVFLRAFGYDLDVADDGIDPKEINRLVKEVEGKPEEELVKTSLVRSMAKAEYSTKNIGHFGLAFQFYTHFTSPIRRYADLLVHRLLEAHLKSEPVSRKELQRYQKMALQTSEKEITAAEAERESKKYKTVEFMLDKVGETFSGVISGVTDWGLYVQDKETGAEGLVKLSSIGNDYYKTKSKYVIEGEKTKKKFRLGDEVKIKLIRADLDNKELDFVFV